MRHLQGLHVLVLGLGQSGLAMARWCAAHGAQVRAWDSREFPPQFDALRAELPDVPLATDPLAAADLAGVQLVLKSPGLAPNDPSVAPLLDAARATGVAVAGELELFARALADLKAERGYAPKVVSVTGTNGKTTTTALASLLIARCGLRVASAGNIGPTMLDTLAAALALEPTVAAEAAAPADSTLDAGSTAAVDEAGASAVEGSASGTSDAFDASDASDAEAADSDDSAPGSEIAETTDDGDHAAAPTLLVPPPAAPVFEHLPEVWVLELSSFQLDGVRGFEPSAAAVLNVSQDHLDWHGSMEAYVAAKARVFGEHAIMVINRDDPVVEAMVPPPQVIKPTHKGARSKTVARRVQRFGLVAPRAPGDFGLVVENGMAWLVRALESDPTIKRRKDQAADDEIHLQRLMPADALHIRGRHNAANALAALALASTIGCPLAPMLHGLREYRGEPHRVEHVATVGGIEAFDDSKGTNVGATVAALNGLGADKAPAKLVIILGGDGKGQDFAPLVAPVARHARAVALIGRDAQVLSQVLAPSGIPQQIHETLEAATGWCFAQAQPGDAVLMSPACASLDMFRNYGHRAEVFVATVTALAAEHGEAL